MPTSQPVGSVKHLWRFPVKSMGGERLQQAEISPSGVLGDRAYALIDRDTGKVASAKSVKLFPDLMRFQAAFVEPPRPGEELPPVEIHLPDGSSVRSDSPLVDQTLSRFFKRNLTLARSAPEHFVIDQYHPDIEGADPSGHRDKIVEQPLGASLFAAIGAQSPLPVGSFLDAFPISVLTTSTLARLNELQPQSLFDERRFRMNLIVDATEPGFAENAWLGHLLNIGSSARITITIPDPRCVMTTLPQSDLPRDTDVLRTLVRHNKLQVGNLGRFPCAGVYAAVAAHGSVTVGDPVTLA